MWPIQGLSCCITEGHGEVAVGRDGEPVGIVEPGVGPNAVDIAADAVASDGGYGSCAPRRAHSKSTDRQRSDIGFGLVISVWRGVLACRDDNGTYAVVGCVGHVQNVARDG